MLNPEKTAYTTEANEQGVERSGRATLEHSSSSLASVV